MPEKAAEIITAAQLLKELHELTMSLTHPQRAESELQKYMKAVAPDDDAEDSPDATEADPFADPVAKQHRNELMRQVITHPDLQVYSLSAHDVWIVYTIFAEYLGIRRNLFDGKELLRLIYPDGLEVMQHTDKLISLLERKIIRFSREPHIRGIQRGMLVPLLEN